MPFKTAKELNDFLTAASYICARCSEEFHDPQMWELHVENHELKEQLAEAKQEVSDMRAVAPSKGLERMLDGLKK